MPGIVDRLFGPKNKVVSFGPIQVSVPRGIDTFNIAVTSLNLDLANRNGVRPVSFGEVITQVDRHVLPRVVLFDSPPSGGLTGNHWRIVSIGDDGRTVSLQHCSECGDNDHQEIPIVELPFDTPFFTGLSIEGYRLNGRLASLSEVSTLFRERRQRGDFGFPDQLKFHSDSIMWSSQNGKLLPISVHPLFRR